MLICFRTCVPSSGPHIVIINKIMTNEDVTPFAVSLFPPFFHPPARFY